MKDISQSQSGRAIFGISSHFFLGPIKVLSILTSFIVMLLLGALSAEAATEYYVRAGATGANNGSDWANAYTSLPATLVRGNTYYVADGSYGGYTFNAAASGTSLITIKKAITHALGNGTSSDYGTEVGWSDSYGDGVALFTGQFNFQTSYWAVDGITGLDNSGHGFEVRPSTPVDVILFGTGVSNITLSHINAHVYAEGTTQSSMTAFYQVLKATLGSSYINISYCYFHHTFGCMLQTAGNTTDYTLDHNYFSNNRSTAEMHAAGICDQNSDNMTVRYNKWKDISGSAIIDLIEGPDVSNNYQFYGNMVWHTGTYGAGLSTIIGVWNDSSNNRTATNWKIYNNSFANIKGVSSMYFAVGSNIDIKNNYWFCNRGTSTDYVNYMYISGAGVSHSNNYWSNCAHPGTFSAGTGEPGLYWGPSCQLSVRNENPFADWPNGNFTIVNAARPSAPSNLQITQ